jgi:hypothetical protein
VQRRWIVALVAGVVIGTLSLGTASALTSSSFTYSAVRTGYYSVNPMDVAPDSLGNTANDYFSNWPTFLANNDPGRCFDTGVHLPQGARIVQITFWYKSDNTSQFYGELDRLNVLTGGHSTLTSTTPMNDANTRTYTTKRISRSVNIVDNKTFSYAIGVCPRPGSPFMGARIKYTYTSAGD